MYIKFGQIYRLPLSPPITLQKFDNRQTLYHTTIKSMNFPSYDEIREFIIDHDGATICQIRDHFNQGGDSEITMLKPNCKKKKYLLAWNINEDFFHYLQDFMKQEYVKVEESMLFHLITGSELCRSSDTFLPIVLSIKHSNRIA